MRLMRSFEEFIFEAASWLLFYPLMLWRVVTQPLTTMRYSDAEQAEAPDGRYDDALSPPLFLLITVVLVNIIAAGLHPPAEAQTSDLSRAILGSPQTLALFRSLVFSLIPLVAAAKMLRLRGRKLSRQTLQPPFYAQCYLAAPCAIVLSGGIALFHRADVSNLAAAIVLLTGASWFLTVQTRWFAHSLEIAWPRAAMIAVWALVQALAYLLVLLIPIALI